MRHSSFGLFDLKFEDILPLMEDTQADQNLMRGSLDNGLKVAYYFMTLDNEVK